jgi:hypothetical protein
MDDIRSLLRIAARRVDLSLLLSKLHESALVAACIALCIRGLSTRRRTGIST